MMVPAPRQEHGHSIPTTMAMSPISSDSAGSSPSASVVPLVQPKKKRVRRQQVELKHLRELSGKLERRLEQLKKRRAFGPQRPVPAVTNCQSSSSPNPQGAATVASIWEGIADRQFKERQRVEKQNQELKTLLRTQAKRGVALEERMQRTLTDKDILLAVLQLEVSTAPPPAPTYEDDDAIVADLLTLLAKIRLELQRRQFEDPRSLMVNASWGLCTGVPNVKTDTKQGLLLECHGCSLLPFSAKIAAAACWRMFSQNPFSKHARVDQEVRKLEDDTVARSFKCYSPHFQEMLGNNTCQKFVDRDGSVTIVFAGRSTSTNVSNSVFKDVQLQNSGWIKVRQAASTDSSSPSSAILEIHAEMLPQFRSAYNELRARGLIDWAIKTHDSMSASCTQTLNDMLLEEDWKAFHAARETELVIKCV